VCTHRPQPKWPPLTKVQLVQGDIDCTIVENPVPYQTTPTMDVVRAALGGRTVLIKTGRALPSSSARHEQLLMVSLIGPIASSPADNASALPLFLPQKVLKVVETGINLKHPNVAQLAGIVWNIQGVPGIVYTYLEDVKAYIGRTPGVDLLDIVNLPYSPFADSMELM
jgi:hypothetical protein